LEIINGEPRRRRSDEEKLAILAEVSQFGSVSRVARRHGINPSMVFAWRKKFCPSPESAPSIPFAPVALIPEPPGSLPAVLVTLGTDIRLSIAPGTDAALAAAVAGALAPFAARR
jgi:transposase